MLAKKGRDRVQKVCLADARRPAYEKGVKAFTRRLGDRQRRAMGEAVGGADHEALEGEPRVRPHGSKLAVRDTIWDCCGIVWMGLWRAPARVYVVTCPRMRSLSDHDARLKTQRACHAILKQHSEALGDPRSDLRGGAEKN